MKLSIAVGILSARSSTLHSAQAAIDSTRRNKKKDSRALLNLSGPKSFGTKKTSSLTDTQSATRSSSRRALSDFKLVECDPEASADVGVLGCDAEETCVAADTSMGGVCYAVDICDPSHSTFEATCDCSAFDLQTKTGIISCPIESETRNLRNLDRVCDLESLYSPPRYTCDCSAFDLETRTGSISCLDSSTYIGCYGVSSLNRTATILLEDSMYTSWAVCYEWVIGVNRTTSSKSCVEWDDITEWDGEPLSWNGTTSCEVQIDGQACASCTYTLAFLDVNIYNNDPWPMIIYDPFKADCSNVADGLTIAAGTYSSLMWTDFPMNQACLDCDLNHDLCTGDTSTIDGASCGSNLCGYGTSFDLTDKTLISLNGSYFTCGGLQWANAFDQISSDKCPEVTALAQAECCKSAAPSSVFSLVLAGILLTGASVMSVLN